MSMQSPLTVSCPFEAAIDSKPVDISSPTGSKAPVPKTLLQPRYLPFPHPASSTVEPCHFTLLDSKKREQDESSSHGGQRGKEIRNIGPGRVSSTREVSSDVLIHLVHVCLLERLHVSLSRRVGALHRS